MEISAARKTDPGFSHVFFSVFVEQTPKAAKIAPMTWTLGITLVLVSAV